MIYIFFAINLCFYAQPSFAATLPGDERQLFNDLLTLLQENECTSGRFPFSIRTPLQMTPSLYWCRAIQVFFVHVCQGLQQLYNNNWTGDNVTKQERLAIKQLSQDVIIKEADKGGNVVIWPIEQYLLEARCQLNNKVYYLILPTYATAIFKQKLVRLLTTATQLKILTKEEFNLFKSGKSKGANILYVTQSPQIAWQPTR